MRRVFREGRRLRFAGFFRAGFARRRRAVDVRGWRDGEHAAERAEDAAGAPLRLRLHSSP